MQAQLTSRLAQIIAYRAGVEASQVTDEVDVLADLGMDSVAFLDATYDLDREFQIRLPVQQWMERVNSGEARLADYFVFGRLVGHVAELLAQRAEAAGTAA
jgi:acyl carrier protein